MSFNLFYLYFWTILTSGTDLVCARACELCFTVPMPPSSFSSSLRYLSPFKCCENTSGVASCAKLNQQCMESSGGQIYINEITWASSWGTDAQASGNVFLTLAVLSGAAAQCKSPSSSACQKKTTKKVKTCVSALCFFIGQFFSYASSSTLYPCQWVSEWLSGQSFELA